MKVNIHTFEKNLPLITEAIKECDYYAIDTEFSGFPINTFDMENYYDTTEARYQKLKFLCQNHLAWEFGLSTFKYNSEINCYQCKAFTFPVFPLETLISKRSYMMTSSALKFLAQHNFPFADVVNDGIVVYILFLGVSATYKRKAT